MAKECCKHFSCFLKIYLASYKVIVELFIYVKPTLLTKLRRKNNKWCQGYVYCDLNKKKGLSKHHGKAYK